MNSIPPVWLGIGISIAYLAAHWVFDNLFLLVTGSPEPAESLWVGDRWWSDVVNAALIGYVPAALSIARSGVARDLEEIRPHLRCTDDEFAVVYDDLTGPGGLNTRVLSLIGVPLGLAIVYVDPLISASATRSFSNPEFIWVLLRMALTGGLVARLAGRDIDATRRFSELSRKRVIVDLLDVRALSPLARRGQRSVLTWALFSSIFSVFWLGDTAANANGPLLGLTVILAAAAYFIPLLGLRKNIYVAKHTELDRLREEIRAERQVADGTSAPGSDQSPRLANLVAYYQLVESTREWPVDATNLVRIALYVALGLGSWFGGALTERALDGLLGG
jgi:hypothetical protein